MYRYRSLFVILLAALLASACQPLVRPAAMPTEPPQEDVAVAADEETQPTTTPEPTNTTVPRTEIPFEAYMTLLNISESMYRSGEYVMVSILYTEMLNLDPSPDLYAMRAETYSLMGDFDAAISDYLAALDLGTNDNSILNSLCWNLGLTGQAEKALPYCEQAVAANPSASHRDSRGLAYAQLGMIQEATTDFQAVVDELENTTDSSLKAIFTERQKWITLLDQGANPITPEVLTQLRNNDIAITAISTPVPSSVAVRRSSVQKDAGELGFAFDEANASEGEETLTGNREEGPCKAVLKLVGPETGLTAASLQASGCSDDEQSGLAYWFMAGLLPGEREQAKAIVYLVLDVYYVIEGEIETTGEQEIGNVIFESRRSETPTPTFEVTARFQS